jgi:hypothetical protein
MGSNLFWQFLCCEKMMEPTEEDVDNMMRESERQTLLHN